MMLYTKLKSYPRIINLACNINQYNCNLQNVRRITLPSINTLNKKYKESHVFTSTICNNKITTNQNFKYATEAIQIPPLPPTPPVEEADIFGTIGGKNYEKVELDKEEQKEERRLKNIYGRVPRKFKPSSGQYALTIKNYVTKGDLENAENVMEECQKNRDIPTAYMYTLLIRAFAMHGDIKKSYKYYNDMKKRRYKVKDNVYTSLINACANCPEPDISSRYLEKVRAYMTKNEVTLNHAHYNVLVKAYGRQRKFEEANQLFQQMIDNKMKVGISTINSLMYAANSNIESGMKDIIHIWQIMRKQSIPPDLFTYNLLLRAIRDTHFGDCSITELLLPNNEFPMICDANRPDLLLYPPVIAPLPFHNIQRPYPNKNIKLLNPPKSAISDARRDTPENSKALALNTPSEEIKELPDSVINMDLDAVLRINKLILFGGVDGILQKMKNDKIHPNHKTLTYLMELVPGSVAAEEAIIKYARSENIALDIDFYNMLIKKRCLRNDKNSAKDVLEYIHKADLEPNIVTYGVLALSCTTAKESTQLLNAMKATGHTLNKYVADNLLSSAFLKLDFRFILELMEQILKEQVRLDESTFEKLDEFQSKISALDRTKHKSAQSDRFKLFFPKFNMRYKIWQQLMGRKVITEREVNEPRKST